MTARENWNKYWREYRKKNLEKMRAYDREKKKFYRLSNKNENTTRVTKGGEK